MQRPKMAGRWAALPFEVIDILEGLSPTAERLYVSLLRHHIIKEDWERPGEWATATIRATKIQIINRARVSEATFYRSAWPDLLGCGLVVDNQDGTITLPKFWKKIDQVISPLEIREHDQRIERLEEVVFQDDGNLRENESDDSQNESDDSQNESDHRENESADILLKASRNRNSSLSLSKIISSFYKGIGQKKISKQKRERAGVVLKKLREDGFGLEDIAFAVNWTLENAREKLYDFSIIQHSIGEALGARDEEERARRRAKAIEERDAEQEAQREREEQEREEMEAYKQSLSAEERAALREKAIAEITESGEYKPQFVNDILIEVKENEILRKRLVEQDHPRPASKC